MKVVKDTGNILVVALDRNDSVGIMDTYLPDAEFFAKFERFDGYIDKHRRADPEKHIGCVPIFSPYYLHDSHVRIALCSVAKVDKSIYAKK